jgi:hypothetical protein
MCYFNIETVLFDAPWIEYAAFASNARKPILTN